MRAAEGNFVPPELYLESAVVFAGAITARQLYCDVEEITPRLYTVGILKSGKGKGTAQKRVYKLFGRHRLLDSIGPTSAPPPCSVLCARPASENGINDALLQTPCVIADFDEMDQLMEKARVEGSGKAMISVLRTLFDGTRPGISQCKGRTDVAVEGYYSLFGSMTPSLWRRAMEGADSYGTGLGGRFNLVASNEDKTVGMLRAANLGTLPETFEKMFLDLDSRPKYITMSDDARAMVSDWWATKGRNGFYNRVNVIAGRKALHIAWITGQTQITGAIMERALKLADYLGAVRELSTAAAGEERSAVAENRVLAVLRNVHPKAARARQIVSLLDGVMSRAGIYRALHSLLSTGEITEHGMRDERGPYRVYTAVPAPVPRVSA
jgi:hypothetical protein